MITRKHYCQNVLMDAMRKYSVADPKVLISHVYESSTMGIALVELGILTEEENVLEYEYLSHRAGIMSSYSDYDAETGEVTTEILTFREFLDLLPKEVK